MAAFAALGLNPSPMIRPHRPFFAHHAFGRLAQARAARGAQRPIRLAAARAAVERAEHGGERARAARVRRRDRARRPRRCSRAGRDRRCRLTVRGRGRLRPDAPLLAYEAARVRARALRALGLPRGGRAAGPVRARHRRRRGLAAPRSAGSPPSSASTAGGRRRRWRTHSRGLRTSRRRGRRPARAAAARRAGAGRPRPRPGCSTRRCWPAIALDETIRHPRAPTARSCSCRRRRATAWCRTSAATPPGPTSPSCTGYSASLVERVRATGEPLVVTGTEEGAALGAQSVGACTACAASWSAPLRAGGPPARRRLPRQPGRQGHLHRRRRRHPHRDHQPRRHVAGDRPGGAAGDRRADGAAPARPGRAAAVRRSPRCPRHAGAGPGAGRLLRRTAARVPAGVARRGWCRRTGTEPPAPGHRRRARAALPAGRCAPRHRRRRWSWLARAAGRPARRIATTTGPRRRARAVLRRPGRRTARPRSRSPPRWSRRA